MLVPTAAVVCLILAVWWWRSPSGSAKPEIEKRTSLAESPESSGIQPDEALGKADPQIEAASLKREAVTIANEVAAAYPEDALSHALLGSAYYNTGQSDEATQHLRRCLELNPKQTDAYEILSRVAYEKGELEESISLCREALKQGPASVELLNQLGRALMDLGRTGEAIEVLGRVAESPRSTSESHYLLGQANLQLGNPSAAKESFQKATRQLPDHTQAFFGLYTACMRLGQTEEAARYREQFLKLEAADRQTLTDRSARDDTLSGLPLVRKTVARTLFGAGQIHRLHGESGMAARLFLKAAFLDADAPAYRAALEALHVQNKTLSEGVKAFEGLAAEQAGNGLNYYFLGRLHERLEQFEAAEQAYQRVQQLAPDWAEGCRALAELYLRSDRNPGQARSLARRAVELDPSGAHYFLLAAACAKMNDRAGAIEAIDQALVLSPNETRYQTFREQLTGAP